MGGQLTPPSGFLRSVRLRNGVELDDEDDVRNGAVGHGHGHRRHDRVIEDGHAVSGRIAHTGHVAAGDRRGHELYKQTDYLLTVVDCEFWLYDEQTGEILAKYSCDDALGGKALPYEGEDDN